jgi:ABC-type dipeptide/oligopeptide/nickel transport system ATPase component
MADVLRLHQGLTRRQARAAAIEMLAKVGIPAPEKRIDEYPHQLSGGMRQRVMIAMALSCGPGLLIADEPTTALDVTTQAQVLEQIIELQKEFGMAMILITHDLGVVAETCQHALVMYCGRIVESSEIKALYKHPRHGAGPSASAGGLPLRGPLPEGPRALHAVVAVAQGAAGGRPKLSQPGGLL